MRLRRRLHHKKLGRTGRAAPAPKNGKSAAIPVGEEVLTGIPVEPTEDERKLAGKSTLVEAQAVSDPMLKPPPRSKASPVRTEAQDDTEVREAIRVGGKPDPNAETEGALDAQLREPDPPDKIGFTCSCGAKLVATKKAYDKRMRCAGCKTLMLVSLVWDPDQRAHEIVPFRVENLPDVPP